jgi:hypothetical protein
LKSFDFDSATSQFWEERDSEEFCFFSASGECLSLTRVLVVFLKKLPIQPHHSNSLALFFAKRGMFIKKRNNPQNRIVCGLGCSI